MTSALLIEQHGPDLLRFATVLCGDDELGELLTGQAALLVADRSPGLTGREWADAVRNEIVRDYLSDGVDAAADVPADADLATRFASSSRRHRSVAVLHYCEYLDIAEVAAALDGGPDDVAVALAEVREHLDAGDGRTNSEQQLRRYLQERGSTVRPALALARIAEVFPPGSVEPAPAPEPVRAAPSDRSRELELRRTEAVHAAELAAAARAARAEQLRDEALARAAALDAETRAAADRADERADAAELAAADAAAEAAAAAADAQRAAVEADAARTAARSAELEASAAAAQAESARAEAARADQIATDAAEVAAAAARTAAEANAGAAEAAAAAADAEAARSATVAEADRIAIEARLAAADATLVSGSADAARLAADAAGSAAEAARTAADATADAVRVARGETQAPAPTDNHTQDPTRADDTDDNQGDGGDDTDDDQGDGGGDTDDDQGDGDGGGGGDTDDIPDGDLPDAGNGAEAPEDEHAVLAAAPAAPAPVATTGATVPERPAARTLTTASRAEQVAFDAEIDAMFSLNVKTPPPYPSQRIVRPLIVLTAVLGLNYLVWRWLVSVNWTAWWIAVPLIIAETYSLIDSLLFGFTMWRLQRRPEPGPPPADATVDVFITTYNEPLDLVMKTARAAQRITFPHTLWILDDGNRPELREIAGAEGIGVISRSDDWIDMPRHAKAGNLNNALMVTQGEFIVILDADQVPAPALLDRTLGYFRDEQMAVVQTPQFFVNVPESDPLGSQAPLFYGPIQQGKDGWNAAFFCGSNAVLRREALLQMGIRRYVHELELRIDDALGTSEKVIKKARAGLGPNQKPVATALQSVLVAARDARAEIADGAAMADATARFQTRVRAAARSVVEADLAGSQSDLSELLDMVDEGVADVVSADVQSEALDRLARRDWSPLGAIETVAALIAAVDVDREDEAQPIMPMSTISVTEDMATCMRMHSMGWKSAYHDEILAVGLAPEDLGTMLTQRLRWAQGTIQVMLRENPLRQKGLSVPQKIMYLGTMWSYLSGFTALAYIAAPIIYLVFGVLPVDALSASFFARLIPFLILNQLLFFVIGRGRSTWRGQQYSLALFPVWIKAVTSAVGNVVLGRSLSFAVTPKTRVQVARKPWHLVRNQLIAMGLLVVASGIGIARLAAGQAQVLGTTINLVWVVFDLVLFSAVIRAVFYKGFEAPEPSEPAESVPEPRPAADLQETSR